MGEELPSQPGRGHVMRAGRAAWIGLIVAAACGCATAGAEGPDAVRVLVYEGADPIVVGMPEQAREIRVAGDGLVVGETPVGAVWAPRGSGPWRVGSRTLRGQIRVRAHSGRVQVLNRVGLEEYVASTVGGEMSPRWPREALRAQAVAARTYVLHEAAKRSGSAWDVRATTASQVYRGIESETDETRAAARSTRGEVLTYGGEPILAVFHSTAGGRTATAGEVWGRDLPYLRVVEVDGEDDAPHTYWRRVVSQADLAAELSAVGAAFGRLEGVRVTRRTRSGRVERLEVRGAQTVEELRGDRLRQLVAGLGLRSTLFDIRRGADGFAFVGSGYGHGVGMSQWGARALAERGVSYQRILARFYPGTRLERIKTRRIAAVDPIFEARSGAGSGVRLQDTPRRATLPVEQALAHRGHRGEVR